METALRTYIKCELEKEISAFPDVQLPNRLKRCFICKACKYIYYQQFNKKKNRVRYNDLETKRRHRYKQEAIRLLGDCCYDCKISFPMYVYDFHHLDPTQKDINPALAFMRSWEKVEEEVIKKCVLLCANCHRKRHYERMDGSPS